MEPHEPVRLNENAGRPRRRISSILKAPRTPAGLSDPEQQSQRQVEVAKPVEKRNSRRVSFAAANDVLLFSKDLENVFSGSSPLQALSTSTTENIDKRLQFGIFEDGTRPITGMETLLNAPLHASQHRNKENVMVHYDVQDDYKERMVMFTGDNILPGRRNVGHNAQENLGEKTLCGEDAGTMDMTHSDTIIIGNYSESDSILPDQNMPTYGNLDSVFSLEKRKAETSAPAKNTSSSAQGLHPDFANFLASFSKPSNTRSNPVMNNHNPNPVMSNPNFNPMVSNVALGATLSPPEKIDNDDLFAQLNARKASMDQENQPPTFSSKVMEKPQSKTRKSVSGIASTRSVVFSDDNMDMTEAPTGRIVANANTDDDPLQFLFPTTEFYEPSGHGSQTKVTLGQQRTEVQAYTRTDPGDMDKSRTSSRSHQGLTHFTGNHMSARVSYNADRTLCLEEHTKYDTSESDDMEITRSQTVAIDTKSLHTVNPLQNTKRKGLAFMVPPNKASNVFEDDCDMTMTQALTVSIDHITNSAGLRTSANPLDGLFPQTNHKMEASFKHRELDQTVSYSDDMEMTKSQTVAIDTKSLHTVNPLQNTKRKGLAFMVPPNKASNVFEDDCDMTMTQALTVSIDHITNSAGLRTSANPLDGLFPQTNHKMEASFKHRELDQTVSYSDDMEMTKSQTVAIDTKSLHTVNPLQNTKRKSLAFMVPPNKASNVLEDECGMDMTKALTVSIDHITNSAGSRTSANPLDSLFPQTNHKMEASFKHRDLDQTVSCSDDMEMTKSQTVAIDTKSLHTVNPLQNTKRKSLAFMVPPNKASNVFEDECGMDMTKALTGSIDHITNSAGSRTSANPLDGLFPQTYHKMEASFMHRELDQTVSYSDDMEMTKSQTVAIDTKSLHTVNPLQNTKRKSLAFMVPPNKANNVLEDECGMDMTKALTVSIDHITNSAGSRTSANPLDSLFPQTNHKMEASFKHRDLDQTVSCSDDMEMTKSQTVAIDTKSLHTVNPLQNTKRKSLAFMVPPNKASNVWEDECGMDMTKALTVSIDHITNSAGSRMSANPSDSLFPQTNHKMEVSFKHRELDQTVSYSDDMEMTKSQTIAIDAKSLHTTNPLQNTKRKSLAFMSAAGPVDILGSNDKFIMDSGDMDLTRTQSVIIDSEIPSTGRQGVPFKAGKSLSSQHERTENLREVPTLSDRSALVDMKIHLGPDGSRHKTDLSHSDDIELTRGQKVALETKHMYGADDHLDNFPQSNVPFEDPSSEFEEDHEMTFTKALTMNIEHLDTAKDAMISSQLPDVLFTGNTTVNPPDPLNSKEMDDQKDPELMHENVSSQGVESSPNTRPAADQVDDSSSKTAKAMRMSLVDLMSKLKRVSNIINEPTEIFSMDSRTEPLSKVEKALDKDAVGDSDTMGITDEADDGMESERFNEEEHRSVTAPLNMKSKGLISRLSMGSFMPKLPQRNKPEPNQMESSNWSSVREGRKTNSLGISHELSSNTLNIEDEVFPNLSSEEDLSETMDTRSSQEINGEEIPHQGHNVEDLENTVFHKSYSYVSQSKKRPVPEDCHEGTREDEKRRKQTVDSIQGMGPPSQNSSITATPSIIKTINSSCNSNSTNLRCEATFESTFQQSAFQSQLEGADDDDDYTDDVGKKVEDESITVSEFFKLFNIDFLHHSRQSILPAKLVSDVDLQPDDLLKDRHITLPKHRVYETDCHSLTDKVAGLKVQMKAQENLLKNVNRPLWEAMKTLSEEEMKCFGGKLKERSNFFRRTNKVLSHEMKVGLYTNLLHTSMEEQQKLRGKIEKTDEVLKSFDDCIHKLEAEDHRPTLKMRQQELESVNRDLADKERQKCEVDEQKRHHVDQIHRLRTETEHLENHTTMLNRVMEWRFVEKKANSTVYTFLYQTLRLEVVFDKSDGYDASDVSEWNVSDITFHLSLDDEAECHARLVHKLVSQYMDDGGSWVMKYPTSLYIPKLLQDVSLVVSRCRLLGEEVHMMKKWGALRLDILDISCADTQVHILFSSLKACVKFELTISVTAAYPYCLPQVHDFHSHIGNTTIHQLEQIVFSITPAKNYLTKIVKRIHETLLC